MFGQKRANYLKLKTNLRVVIHRLKLLEKKKTEKALKDRKEIADYLQAGKVDRARIRVEHIVREDYLVEAMEILEMFCDLLLARFGLVEKVKEMDPSLEKAIATLIWAAPRLASDVPEFNVIAYNLVAKYGKEFGEECKTNKLELADETVVHRMSIYSPPKELIENYMVAIAQTYKVDFTPDPTCYRELNELENTGVLIDFGNQGDGTGKGGGHGGTGGTGGGGGFGGGGGGHFGVPAGAVGSTEEKTLDPNQNNRNLPNPSAPFEIPDLPTVPGNTQPLPFNYPSPQQPLNPGGHSQTTPYPPQAPTGTVGFNQGNMYPATPGVPPPGMSSTPPVGGYPPGPPVYNGAGPQNLRPPQPPSYDATMSAQVNDPVDLGGIIPQLPSVPGSLPGGAGSNSAGGDDVDFDDLTRRFDELKRKK